jgi:DNA-directed RNA polymerase specialized sigma24 family protein
MAQAELSRGQSEVPELRALSSGPRAALLLRMVGGLDFPHAAGVLGISEATYRFALQRALQQLGEGGISYAVLGALRERLHRQVKTLPETRTASLAALRARVLKDEPEAPPAPPRPASPVWRRLAWVALALLALGFAATFWTPASVLPPGGTEALPIEAAPVPVPATAASDWVMHPDYTLLAAPGDERLATELALLSWIASGEAGELPAPAAVAPRAPPVGESPSANPPPAPVAAFQNLPQAQRALLAPLAGAWPGLEPETMQRLQANAAHWLSLDAAGREALVATMRAWDGLPAADRAQRRGPFAAWQSLSADERRRVQAVADALAALSPEQQQALRDGFEKLPPDQRQDWWLGPEIGPGFAQLRPLFAFVPEDERTALLALLRALSPEARADLAVLARRLPANQRESLRRDLMAAPAAEREALIRARAGR